MIIMKEECLKNFQRQSSKGNQLKWVYNNIWYKADYAGYEGLAEYMVSHLLQLSTMNSAEYVMYQTDQIQYKRQMYLGCQSSNFLSDEWQLITLERLFKNKYGRSLMEAVYKIADCEDRIKFLIEQTIRMTGLVDFGIYLSKLLTIDAVFLNEDRHMHNIAVLMNSRNQFQYCPIFDNGATLLSDTTMDYPMQGDLYEMITEVPAKTFSQSFDEQLDCVEALYGNHLKFQFTPRKVDEILKKDLYYPENIKERISEILRNQIRKYEYLFK